VQDGGNNSNLCLINVMPVTPTLPQVFLHHQELQPDTRPAQVLSGVRMPLQGTTWAILLGTEKETLIGSSLGYSTS
jgi:hypothetical protein